jgi:lysine biosynthesis protein LysW
MAQQKNSNVALCPECEGPVRLSGKLQVGQKLSCRRCGSNLVVFERRPLELVAADGGHGDITHAMPDKKRDKGDISSSNKQYRVTEENPQMAAISSVSLADCPECNATLRFHKQLRQGQLVVCPECEETLEVTSLRPLHLNWANEDPWEYEAHENSRQRVHR